MEKEEAYDFLYRMAEGISIMFGNNCETLIHEIKDGKIWTVAIFNGHVSGRKAMTTLGILGGTLSDDEIDMDKMTQDACNQLVIHPTGKKIKSSTFFIKGKDYHYALGINYDITLMDQMKHMLGNFVESNADLSNTLRGGSDITVESIFTECVQILNRPVEKINKNDRISLISLLKERNFFEIQKSVPFLAERLKVSKYTIYKDLNKLK